MNNFIEIVHQREKSSLREVINRYLLKRVEDQAVSKVEIEFV